MTKKTRRQKGGATLFNQTWGLFGTNRSKMPTPNSPNYLIDLMLYNGTDDETLSALQTYTGSFDPFKPTSHKDESLLYMAHKRKKVKVVKYLLLRNCNPMTVKCYWNAINFIKDYPRYDELWREINNTSQGIDVLDPDVYNNIYSYDKKTKVYSESIDKSSLNRYLSNGGKPGLILPYTARRGSDLNFTPLLLMQGGKRTHTRKFLKL